MVGGGIGGLATAIALSRADWDVTILEQAPVFWEAGAGLTITPNGARALSELGVADAVRRDGHAIRPAGIRDQHGRWLVRLPADPRLEAVAVHRRSLHSDLLDRAAQVALLRPGARVLELDVGEVGGRKARVRYLEGTTEQTITADLLIGADGADSIVRQHITLHADVRHSGYTAWRAVVTDSELLGRNWTVWWGSGAEFSAQRIGPDRISWYCLRPHDGSASLGDDLATITELLAGYPAEVVDVLELTRPESVFRHDIAIAHGPMRTFSSGRAVLVGDAAHPMLPTLNQGANLALEDGVVLGGMLTPSSDLTKGLRRFDNLRVKRTRRLAANARLLASIGAGCPTGLEQVVRDGILTRLPARLLERGVHRVVDWRPPMPDR